jgi:hypothetical protein
MNPSTTQYVIIFLAIALFIYRQTRPQKLTRVGLWLLPVFLVLVTLLSVIGTSFAAVPGFTPPSPVLVAFAVLIGLVAGIPLGLARGRASKVRLGEKQGTMIVEPSLLFAAIWLGAFALRTGLRLLVPTASPAYFALSDASIVFAASTIVALRYVLFSKFKALHLESAEVSEG